jgi:phage gpG-like protein
MQEFSEYIKKTSNVLRLASAYALLEIGQKAELYAKQNIKEKFGGRNNYTLSGGLLNSIFNRFTTKAGKSIAIIGSKGVPYARIHEFGGIIKPVNAKYLWMRTPEANAKGIDDRRMRPKDFYKQHKAGDKTLFYDRNENGLFAMREQAGDDLPIFQLIKRAKIPKIEYLKPAVMKASDDYFPAYKLWIKKLKGTQG